MSEKNKRLLVLAILGVVLIQLTALYSVRRQIAAGTADFGALYARGKAVLEGRHPSYEVRTHASVQDEYTADLSARDYPPPGSRMPDALHPPYEVLLLAPLAALPYRAAYFVWYGCNALMLAAVALLLWSRIPNFHQRPAWLAIPIGTFLPVLISLVQGQDSILLLLLLTVFYLQLRDRQELRAGMVLALAMFKFVLVLPIAAALVVARKGRALLGFTVGCAALLLLSVAVVGPREVFGYPAFLFRFGRVEQAISTTKVYIMPNLRGFVYTVTHRSADRRITIAVILASVVILAAALRWWGNNSESVMGSLDLRFSLLIAAAVVVSYHCYVHDAAILLLPLLLAGNYFLAEGSRRSRVVFAGSVAVMYALPHLVRMEIAMPVFFCALMVLLFTLDREAGQVVPCAELQPGSRAAVGVR